MLGGSPRRRQDDRRRLGGDVRRPVREPRPRQRSAQACAHRRPAGAAAETVGAGRFPVRRLRRDTRRDHRGARVRARRAGRPRCRFGRVVAHVSRGARPAGTLGPRSRAALRRGAGGERAGSMGREAGLRLRVRRPDSRAMGARRGAVGTRGRHCFVAVRARAAGVLGPGTDGRDALAAGGGKHRGAAGRFSRVRATGHCSCRAMAVRGCSRRAAGTGGRGAFPRGGGFPWGAGAGGRRDPRARPRRNRPCRHRDRRTVARALARAARDDFRRARHPVCARGTAASRPDTVRQRAAVTPSLRLARRRPARPLCIHALAVFGTAPRPRRLSRGPAARASHSHARARRAGDAEAARAASAVPRRASCRGVEPRRRRQARSLDADGRPRARRPSGVGLGSCWT